MEKKRMYTISGTIFNTDFMSKYFGCIESSKIHCPKFYLFLTHGTRERSGAHATEVTLHSVSSETYSPVW